MQARLTSQPRLQAPQKDSISAAIESLLPSCIAGHPGSCLCRHHDCGDRDRGRGARSCRHHGDAGSGHARAARNCDSAAGAGLARRRAGRAAGRSRHRQSPERRARGPRWRPEHFDALGAGGAAAGREVLADTDNAPVFVLGRGGARGILGPASEPFALALLFSRIETAFVAVPDPQSNTGANNRLNKSFPTLFREGTPDYGVVYQNNTWRIFGRLNITDSNKH